MLNCTGFTVYIFTIISGVKYCIRTLYLSVLYVHTCSVRMALKEFCVQFLECCYNPIMRVVKDNIQHQRAMENDDTYYLWAVRCADTCVRIFICVCVYSMYICLHTYVCVIY